MLTQSFNLKDIRDKTSIHIEITDLIVPTKPDKYDSNLCNKADNDTPFDIENLS
jgi:hypothetical protein